MHLGLSVVFQHPNERVPDAQIFSQERHLGGCSCAVKPAYQRLGVPA